MPTKQQEHFLAVRQRLSKVWAKPQIDRWLAKEHQNLNMRSPAHMIHKGEHHVVYPLIEQIEKNRG